MKWGTNKNEVRSPGVWTCKEMGSHIDQKKPARSDIASSAKTGSKKDQVLPVNQGFRFRPVAADGDGLRSRATELLYGRPVSTKARAEVHKPCSICELRERIQREESQFELGMKWGTRKKRSIRLRKTKLAFFYDWQHGLPPVAVPDGKLSPCLGEMISNETRPNVAHMEKWPPLHSPVLGPETPVRARKRYKRRKSGNHVFNNSRGLHPRFKDQSVIDTHCAGSHLMMPLEGGKLVTQLTVYLDPPDAPQTPVCCSQEQEISTSPPKFQSSISLEASRVQPAAQSSKCQPSDYRVESPGAKGGHTEGSDEYCNTILDISRLVNAVEDFGSEQVYSRQVIGEELEQNDWTSPEESADAAVLNDPEYVVRERSRSRNARKKLSVDLNQPVDKDDFECLLEEEKSLQPSQKTNVKKHTRPRVLKDVIKPV
ncbi:hypothetical protein R1sor_019288 [Riccia sorocarpa]|uniref:Uncharacterized protein n=1 Tax=Riccia sorocarpa TaxID=122646 RepID=A0ABD3ID68_9MARC